jgi:transcriptional regulator
MSYCFPIEVVPLFYGYPIREDFKIPTDKSDVWQGTLALMVLKTLETMGPLHGYGIARRIEQTSGNRLAVKYGTLYPALLKLEQEGYVASEWGVSDNNRKAKYYKLTRAGRKQVAREAQEWEKATAILARFLAPGEERS